jgi:hypothetical protein
VRRRAWALAAVPAAAVAAGAVAISGGAHDATAAQEPAVATGTVARGTLDSAVTLTGILTHHARPAVVNRARGTYTALPATGATIGCGGVLYRVDDAPVLLLCGAVPAYRALRIGDSGRDVRQLNRALRVRAGDAFTWRTQRALRDLQRRRQMAVTGRLALGDAVFLPAPVRVARAVAALGAAARPGAPVLRVTSRALAVEADLDATQQGQVRRGDRVRITLPGNRTARGRVARIGAVAAGGRGGAGAATLPASISLDDPRQARGLDQAPVQADVTTRGVDDVLSVPVTALVGRAGGGFAVAGVRAGGQRTPVVVTLGLFDTSGGRVEVAGDLRAGDRVVVPAG